MLITAVITTFKRPQRVRRAIRSVLSQTYEPLEILVVEDGSDSGTEGWLRDQGLASVKYVRHPENRGLAAARNTGLKLTGGEYVAYLDDDNEWKPRRIEMQVELVRGLGDLGRKRLGVVYCGVEVRERDGSRVYGYMGPKNRGNLREAIVREGAVTLPSTCLFSRAALERVGGFDEAMRSSVDHDIWMSLAAHGYEAHAVDEHLAIEHVSREQRMTVDTGPRIQGVRKFLEKWRPTYGEWLGESEASGYVERYRASVLGRLAADKLVYGHFVDAWRLASAVSSDSRRKGYAFALLLNFTLQAVARRVLPGRAVKLLKRLKAGSVGQ